MALALGVLLSVALVISAALTLAALRPSHFTLSRSRLIKSTPEALFPFINDFTLWALWSPWNAIDPHMVRTYGAITAGEGATYSWTGTRAGAGEMTIERSDPGREVVIKLAISRPLNVTNHVVISLVPQAGGTRVEWTMSGPSPLLSRLVELAMPLDRMVGRSFEDGLAHLAALVER